MARISRLYFRGRKSTSLETTELVYDPVTDDWWARWVLEEELDRRRGRARIPPARVEFKRLMAATRSSF